MIHGSLAEDLAHQKTLQHDWSETLVEDLADQKILQYDWLGTLAPQLQNLNVSRHGVCN